MQFIIFLSPLENMQLDAQAVFFFLARSDKKYLDHGVA